MVIPTTQPAPELPLPVYVLVRTGRIIGREVLVASGVDAEQLANDADTLAPLHPGQTFTVRGPNGELLYTKRVESNVNGAGEN